MKIQGISALLVVLTCTSAVEQEPSAAEQPRMVYYYQPGGQPSGLSRPIINPELGMAPQYHNLVYNYVTGMAGTNQPQEVYVQPIDFSQGPEKVEDFDIRNPDFDGLAEPDSHKEQTTEHPVKPGLQDHALPSDFLFLSHNPQSQFFGNFDAIKMKKMKYKTNKETLPPLGGVISNYVLLRSYPDYQAFLPFARGEKEATVTKRQAFLDYNTDDVVITTDEMDGGKKREEKPPADKEEDKEEQPEQQPAVAQSKPSAIALAGPGGIAQASPVGTALVGPGGLAVSAPSGTAVAGPAGQGAIIANPDEKMKTLAAKKQKDSTYSD